jgi:hypothetical protein
MYNYYTFSKKQEKGVDLDEIANAEKAEKRNHKQYL